MALQHLPYTFMFGLRMSSRKIKDTHYVDANVYLANLFSFCWKMTDITDFALLCGILHYCKASYSELFPNFCCIKRMVTFYDKELIL